MHVFAFNLTAHCASSVSLSKALKQTVVYEKFKQTQSCPEKGANY